MKQIPDMLDDHHPRRNVHGHQLLEQQLGCVRKFHLKFNKKSQISRCVMKTINFISDQIILLAKKSILNINSYYEKEVYYLRDLRFVLATLALERVVTEVGNGDQAES